MCGHLLALIPWFRFPREPFPACMPKRLTSTSSLTASEAYNRLNGVFCIYKPPLMEYSSIKRSLSARLVDGLNSLPDPRIEKLLQGSDYSEVDTESLCPITMIPSLSYEHHPLVVGPTYTPDVIQFFPLIDLPREYSGIYPIGIGERGKTIGLAIRDRLSLRKTFRIKGTLGIGTDSDWDSGRVVDKKYYGHVTKHRLQGVLATFSTLYSRDRGSEGLEPLQSSQRAFEGAARGEGALSMHLIRFQSPALEVEVNVKEENLYLPQLMLRLALRLRTTGTTSGIRFSRWGSLTARDALLEREWTVGNVAANIEHVSRTLEREYGMDERVRQIAER